MCDAILVRTVARLDACLPDVSRRLFGTGALESTILHNPGLRFSPGEPAINIYTAGGDCHTPASSNQRRG